LVKNGDLVLFTVGREAFAIGLALAARKEELEDVQIAIPTPGYDFGWYDQGWEDSFSITIGHPTAVCQDALDAGRINMRPWPLFTLARPSVRTESPPDFLLVELSPPDEKGFCSFGASLWNKKRDLEQAKVVIAEINNNLIRTHGDNFVHVSEIDYFVEHIGSGRGVMTGSLAGREVKQPEPYIKSIAENVGSIMKDGDTFQIGVGRITEYLVQMGMLANKQDLGYHAEATPSGIITAVKEGVITGKYKTLFPDKVVITSLGGGTVEEMEWANGNPLFWLVSIDFLEDARTLASLDNLVSINQALAVDLRGQAAAESLGYRILSQAGGHRCFAFQGWAGYYSAAIDSSRREGFSHCSWLT
jgi:4-hydroxybutyrate CoA-transferase